MRAINDFCHIEGKHAKTSKEEENEGGAAHQQQNGQRGTDQLENGFLSIVHRSPPALFRIVKGEEKAVNHDCRIKGVAGVPDVAANDEAADGNGAAAGGTGHGAQHEHHGDDQHQKANTAKQGAAVHRHPPFLSGGAAPDSFVRSPDQRRSRRGRLLRPVRGNAGR